MNRQKNTQKQKLSDCDQSLVDALRGNCGQTISELVDLLGVTATAVRQRIDRLMAMDLVGRQHEGSGRGRPSFRYFLTESGKLTAGDNLGHLAVALWQEIQSLADRDVRDRVIKGATNRLAERYAAEVSGDSIAEKMASLATVFSNLDIPIRSETISGSGLTVLTVDGCPYPELSRDNRDICDLERRVVEKVIGAPVDLCRCQHDGDQCCTFREASVPAASEKKETSGGLTAGRNSETINESILNTIINQPETTKLI